MDSLLPLLVVISYPIAWVISDKRRRWKYLAVWDRRGRKKQGVYYWLVTTHFYTVTSLKLLYKKKFTSKLSIFYTNRIRITYCLSTEGTKGYRAKRRATLHLFFVDDKSNVIRGTPIYYVGALGVMYTDILLKDFMNPSAWAFYNVYDHERVYATKSIKSETKLYIDFVGPVFTWWAANAKYSKAIFNQLLKLKTVNLYFLKKKANTCLFFLNKKINKKTKLRRLVLTNCRIAKLGSLVLNSFFFKKNKFFYKFFYFFKSSIFSSVTYSHKQIKKSLVHKTKSYCVHFNDKIINFFRIYRLWPVVAGIFKLLLNKLKIKGVWSPQSTRLPYFKKIKSTFKK